MAVHGLGGSYKVRVVGVLCARRKNLNDRDGWGWVFCFHILRLLVQIIDTTPIVSFANAFKKSFV